MNKSTSIIELSKALNAFQAGLKPVSKDGKNPFFGSNYATLDNIWDTIRKDLAAHGLSIAQFPEGKNGLTTILMHISGEWMEATAEFSPKDNLPQSQGSGITYFRRYAMAAVLGLTAEEDDDGNHATKPVERLTPDSREPYYETATQETPVYKPCPLCGKPYKGGFAQCYSCSMAKRKAENQ